MGDRSASELDKQGAQTVANWLHRLAAAYHEVYNGQQEGKMMFGMRDYYAFLKLLRRKMATVKKKFGMTSEVLTLTVSRNFGGKASMLKWANKVFHMHCLGFPPASGPPPVRLLIADSLKDADARHMMLFTRDSAALDLLFGAKLVDPATCTVMVGSSFKEDSAELELIQQINQVRHTMAAGRTLVLVNHFNIFEALYDLLNMKYVGPTSCMCACVRVCVRACVRVCVRACVHAPLPTLSDHGGLLPGCGCCPAAAIGPAADKFSCCLGMSCLRGRGTGAFRFACCVAGQARCGGASLVL